MFSTQVQSDIKIFVWPAPTCLAFNYPEDFVIRKLGNVTMQLPPRGRLQSLSIATGLRGAPFSIQKITHLPPSFFSHCQISVHLHMYTI